ncbi:LysR family transcriptional regulator [Vitiosangium sp. GDMCC 1.1324]|uniref:LysR family transcriptional regulator n=1 Tax=Vitiosangium sp. (strain GDMCC 1.1324) TaxID=2138576 RepID=UPI000D36DFDC|nr:LysR family transcriptional regulator [Vitiosangium sp. GDMCC 1.1324]PTL85758.1 LysR family transcriptional regulator [Vitiosangium sp. GDMCC 1.1324]
MDIPWEDVRLFLAVAETGSLSGAARRLRIGQPTVSRRLAALEYSLGGALFRRSVDGASLTSAGERLLVPAKKMAEWAGEVGRAVESSDRSPRGLVRITAAPLACFDFVVPFAAWLAGKHPGLRLEVLSSIQYLDLNRGEADLALRTKAPTQEGLKVLLELELQNSVFVSKSLAAKLPRKPSLAELPWIAWAPPFDMVPPNPQLEELIPGFAPVFTSDNFLVQVEAAEAGLGAVVLPHFRHRISRPSSLVPLAIDLGPYHCSSVYLVCAKSVLDIPRVRLVSELLVSELEKFGGSSST